VQPDPTLVNLSTSRLCLTGTVSYSMSAGLVAVYTCVRKPPSVSCSPTCIRQLIRRTSNLTMKQCVHGDVSTDCAVKHSDEFDLFIELVNNRKYTIIPYDLVLPNSPVSANGSHQRAQDDGFVFLHENVQVVSIVRNRDLVLLDDAIYGRSNSRLLTFSVTGVADVVLLSEQTRRKTP
jgi:hypothetical protein